MAAILAYIAATVVAVWGVAHAAPTRQVIAGFRPITADNRRIVLQEWLAEAFTTWGIAAVVIVVTAVSGPGTSARTWVYRTTALLLIALAALTALTRAAHPSRLVQDLPGATGRLGSPAADRKRAVARAWYDAQATGNPAMASPRQLPSGSSRKERREPLDAVTELSQHHIEAAGIAGRDRGGDRPVHHQQMTEFFVGQAAHRDDEISVSLDLAEVIRAAPHRGSSCGSVV